MQVYKMPIRAAILSLAFCASPLLAGDCGERPEAPEVIDGASASMDELVANSESVKAFIAEADTYLDCNEELATSDEFKELDPAEQKRIIKVNKALLKERNDIGQRFNEQVADYQAANPQ